MLSTDKAKTEKPKLLKKACQQVKFKLVGCLALLLDLLHHACTVALPDVGNFGCPHGDPLVDPVVGLAEDAAATNDWGPED